MRQAGGAMTGNGDPPHDSDRTVFRPSPGGRPPDRPSPPGGGPPPPSYPPPPAWPGAAPSPHPPHPPHPFAPAPAPGFPSPAPPAFPGPPLERGGADPFAAQPGGFPPPPLPAPPPLRRAGDDDIPAPATPRDRRSPLVGEAGPILALAASVRSGRARMTMPAFHREASEAIARYDRAIAPLYPDEVRQRARYAICATVDDIAQNLPNIGQDGAEWARRSLVVQFFRENIGGDRFWQLVDEVLARPAPNAALIELFHACLAAGFEGRFRVMPDGRNRLGLIMASLYGALEHPRSLSPLVISPQWTGVDAPPAKVGLFDRLLLVAAGAGLGLLLIYILLRLLLASSGDDSWTAVRGLTPDEPLRMSRTGAAAPAGPASEQLSRLRRFLAPEIRQKLVAVEEDSSTVRVRTTVGQLFQSGSDQLEPGRKALFERIGRAVEDEPGQVTIEGHADSDKLSASLIFPDNIALSRARAETIAALVGALLSNPARIEAKGFGDSRPIATNATASGKALNRRVEIVLPRRG
ncbi:MAG: type IVB secretion system protein IcmH/DotU [Novosphingobium sp.]